MPRDRPDDLRPGLTWPVRLDPSGVAGPTPSSARGPRWRRSSHGLFVPAEVDSSSPEQRIVEAAARLPAGAAVTGWAALRWLGARWLDGRTADGRAASDVTVVCTTLDLRRQAGVALSAERLPPEDVIEVDGVPVTVPVRSVCFELRHARGLVDGVVVADMAAHADLVSCAEVEAYLPALAGWTGVQRVRDGLAWMDENSWSPWETRTRFVWTHDADLPRPLCNVPVFDRAGRHLGTPDLLDPVAGLAGEYDGASYHLGQENRRRDVGRESVLRDAGLELVHVVAGEHRDPEALALRLRNARRRSRWEDPASRRWTIEPPAWWRSTTTVAERRALRSEPLGPGRTG